MEVLIRLSQEVTTPVTVSSSMKSHTAEEIFSVIGDWSFFYLKVIFLNSLIRGVAKLELKVYDVWRKGARDYDFYDCEGTPYKRLGHHCDSEEHSQLIAILARNLGSLFGCFLCAWFASRYQPRVGILYGAVICFAGGIILFFKDQLYMFVAWFFLRCGSQMMRIFSFMHCIECVPCHVRPLAVGLMLINEYLIELILFMALLKSEYWEILKIVVPAVLFLIASFNYFVSPPSILFTIGIGDTKTLKRFLKNTVPGSQDILNIDYLVGDIIYRGQISFSKLSSFVDAFKIKPFSFKLCLLSLLLMAREATDVLYNKVTNVVLPIAYMENEMVVAILKTGVMIVALVILFTYGRRIMLLLFCLCVVVGNTAVFTIAYGPVNICDRYFKPRSALDLFLSIFGVLLSNVAVDIGNVVLRLLMAEHIPTVNRTLFLPVMYGMKEFAGIGQLTLNNYIFGTASKENALTILMLVNTLVVALLTPTVLFIDNTNMMPTTTADIPCYYRPRDEYDKQPRLDDRSDDPCSSAETLSRERT